MAEVRIVPADDPESLPRPRVLTEFEDWGEFDPRAPHGDIEHWLIVLGRENAATVVGSLSAQPVYYGPTAGSRAANIGISVLEEHRNRGIGAEAQRLLAEELHARGVVRVEASTDVRNVPEQRALARAGFVREGVLRRAQARRDGVHDLEVWSHLAGD